MDVLYIVMPAYNEEANISSVIEEWYPVIKNHDGNGASRLLIINDGSTDSTGEILDSLCCIYPLLEVIHKENGGHGPAVIKGYKHAIENHADFVFQTDSDGQTSALEFEYFWNHRFQYSMIIGKRSAREDGLQRKFVSHTLQNILLASFRTRIPDANTPYRLMEAGCLKEQLKLIKTNEPLPNIMLSAIYAKRKLPVLYKKITFRNRQGGTNSINMKKISKIGLDSIQRFISLDKYLSKEAKHETHN